MQRARALSRILREGPDGRDHVLAADCEVAQMLAGRLGMEPSIVASVGQIYERWDGDGSPARLKGETIRLSARIVMLATGVELRHHEGGVEGGAGQPLLFIHGMCGDATVWLDQMGRLSLHFRCIAYDRRGHLRSPLGQVVRRTVELHADDAAQLILESGLAPCLVVGSSSGAHRARSDPTLPAPGERRCAFRAASYGACS